MSLFSVVVSIGRGMLGEIQGCFPGSQKLHQIVCFSDGSSESLRGYFRMSGVIARCLRSCLRIWGVTDMFMLPFETRDSKHCCVNVVLVVRREYYACRFFLCYNGETKSKYFSIVFFWCERLARGLVQNLFLKTKEDVFCLRLY
jgi:hypothetical protein